MNSKLNRTYMSLKQNYPFEIFKHLPHTQMLFIEGTGDTPFNMGDEYGDVRDRGNVRQVHPVHLSDFYLAQYPVTQALWYEVMKGTELAEPSAFKSKNRPVEQVSWDDICGEGGFLERLNQIPHIRALNEKYEKQFRLPTEAQWEYAARGGKNRHTHSYKYAGSNHLKEVGWYDTNSHQSTQPVGLKMPNSLDLYDMSGNVREWCTDHWHGYSEGLKNGDKAVEKEGERRRLVRGGSWDYFDDFCRVAIRFRNYLSDRNYYYGCRLSWY
ncbi:MAG: formylglycine-generating enzyme family protein [Chitinophagales bacterium]